MIIIIIISSSSSSSGTAVERAWRSTAALFARRQPRRAA
jgi:hypothetical protein